MNEMYAMSQSIHIYSVIGLILTLILMIVLHKLNNEFDVFLKRIKMLTIVHFSVLGFVVMTGTVMMAAKHLSMTPANLLMIVAVFIVLGLEIKRNKLLAQVVKFKSVDEEIYKKIGLKYQSIELVLLIAVSTFAGMASAISL